MAGAIPVIHTVTFYVGQMPDNCKTDTKVEHLQKAEQTLVYGPVLT